MSSHSSSGFPLQRLLLFFSSYVPLNYLYTLSCPSRVDQTTIPIPMILFFQSWKIRLGRKKSKLAIFTITFGPILTQTRSLGKEYLLLCLVCSDLNLQSCTWKTRTGHLWAIVIPVNDVSLLCSLSAYLLPDPLFKAIKKSNKITKPHFWSMHSGQMELRLSLQNIYN